MKSRRLLDEAGKGVAIGRRGDTIIERSLWPTGHPGNAWLSWILIGKGMIVSRLAFLSICTVVASLAYCLNAADKGVPPAHVELCSKEYRILSPVGEKELGKYGFKAVLTKAAKRIEIVEFLSMDYRGDRKSVV